MKKRTRLLVFLVCISLGLAFLYPTFQWYVVFNKQDRADAGLNTIQLRSAVLKAVDTAIEEFESNNISDANKTVYKALGKSFIKKLKDYNSGRFKDERIKIKSSYTYTEIKEILSSFMSNQTSVDNFIKVEVLEEYYKNYYQSKADVKKGIIKLGLDLQGGAYAVVRINYDHPLAKEKFNKITKEEKPDAISTFFSKITPAFLKKNENKTVQLDEKVKQEIIKKAMLTIENRINRYGVSETAIQSTGSLDRIIINLPGVTEVNQLRQIIETVGILEFRLVSEEGSRILYEMKNEADKKGISIFDKNRKMLPEYQAKLPPDTEALFIVSKDEWGRESENQGLYVLEKENLLFTAEGVNSITNAYVDRDRLTSDLTVNFSMNDEAAKRWALATERNVNRRVAIVLDNMILQEPPTIREKISGGNTQITLGNVPEQELFNLALILRSGSLDVPLEIAEENTIGASLGQDTIESGVFAMILSAILVFGFMILWYSVGGLIADIAMILNLTLLLGGLAIFNGTLTLPGIAGIVLTIGMAVDSNVIIYERIKEEFRSGKTFKTAVSLGFDKAFWTILDSNLTTFAAGIGLSFFGTGPIKGFAVTLCLGIMCTLFAALFATRLLFDFVTTKYDFKSLRFISTFKGN